MLSAASAVQVSGETAIFEHEHQGQTSTQHACGICHTRLFNETTAAPGMRVVRAGILEGAERFAPVAHIGAVEVGIAQVQQAGQHGIDVGQATAEGEAVAVGAVHRHAWQAVGQRQGAVEHAQRHADGAGGGIRVPFQVDIGHADAADGQGHVLKAVLRAGQGVDRGVVLLDVAGIGALRVGIAQGDDDLTESAAVTVDAHAQVAQRLWVADHAGRCIDAVHTQGQHAELIAAVAVSEGAELQVVGGGVQAPVSAGPGQGYGLPGQAWAVGHRAVGGRAGVVPQGAGDHTEAGVVAQDVLVRAYRAAGSLAFQGAIVADCRAAPAGEVFGQAGPGQGGITAGDHRVVGQLDLVAHADLVADVQLGKVHGQAASGAEAHAARQIAWPIGDAIDADAHQAVVAAAGKAVAQLRVEGRQAAILGEVQLHRGRATGAGRVGVEADDLFVQAGEAGFDDAFEQGLAAGAGVTVDPFVGLHPQLCTGGVAGLVGHTHVEFQHHAFQVGVGACAVDHIAEVEGDYLAAIRVGDDGQAAGVEHAGGRQPGKVRGDRQRFGAAFVARDVQGAANDEVSVAGQATVGNKTDAQGVGQRIRRYELQAVGQGDLYLVVGVVAFRHQYHHAVADDFADGHRLLHTGGRGGCRAVGQAADSGYLDGLGHRDQQQRAVAVVVEHAAVEQAVHTGTFAAVAAIQAGPLHRGKVADGCLRGCTGVDHTGQAKDDAAALGDVDVGTGGGAQLAADNLEVHATVVAGAILVQHARQAHVVQLAGQVVEETDVEGIEVVVARTIAQGDGEGDDIALVVAAGACGGGQRLADLHGRLAQGHGGCATAQGHITVDTGATVGRVAVGVAVGKLGAVLQQAVGLVVADVAGHQLHANHEAVVVAVVVGSGTCGAEGPAGIHTIGAQGATRACEAADHDVAGKIGGQRTAAGAGGDQLVAQAVVEAGVQAHARWYQVFDAQGLCIALGQGDDDVITHAFAHHQVAAGGVAGAGVAIVQAAVGERLADGRGRHLLAGQVTEVDRGEVGAPVDAGVVAEGGAGLQAAAGLDAGADHHVVADHHQVGTALVGGGATAPGQQGGLTTCIEEGDLLAVDAVVHASYQRRAVAQVDLQVGRGQAAADEAQAIGQRDAGHHVVGAATAAVLDGSDQAQCIATVDAGDVAIDLGQIGDAAIEGR
nr:GFA family protein [Pseudomonas putida]